MSQQLQLDPETEREFDEKFLPGSMYDGEINTDTDKLKNWIAQSNQRAVAAERERIKIIVDKVRKEIYQLDKQGTLEMYGEKLDLITKYQAVNMITLSDLPYTRMSEFITPKETVGAPFIDPGDIDKEL